MPGVCRAQNGCARNVLSRGIDRDLRTTEIASSGQSFETQLVGHSMRGSALTMRGVQKQRPSLWSLRDAMQNMSVPTLIVAGDEDDPCLEPGLMMKRMIATAGYTVIPRSGHVVNLEEPDEFNRIAYGFITAVETGRWSPRDPHAVFPHST